MMIEQVLKKMQSVSPHPDKMGIEIPNSIYIYASPQTVHRAVCAVVEEFKATDVDDLDALAAQDGYEDVVFGFTVQGQRIEVCTVYEED